MALRPYARIVLHQRPEILLRAVEEVGLGHRNQPWLLAECSVAAEVHLLTDPTLDAWCPCLSCVGTGEVVPSIHHSSPSSHAIGNTIHELSMAVGTDKCD
jgi:hypothetical protein